MAATSWRGSLYLQRRGLIACMHALRAAPRLPRYRTRCFTHAPATPRLRFALLPLPLERYYAHARTPAFDFARFRCHRRDFARAAAAHIYHKGSEFCAPRILHMRASLPRTSCACVMPTFAFYPADYYFCVCLTFACYLPFAFRLRLRSLRARLRCVPLPSSLPTSPSRLHMHTYSGEKCILCSSHLPPDLFCFSVFVTLPSLLIDYLVCVLLCLLPLFPWCCSAGCTRRY